MAKTKFTWHIQFYGSGGWLHNKFIDARTKQEALAVLRGETKVIEIVCCRLVLCA